MTPNEIADELERLEGKATPGPWRTNTLTSFGQDWPVGVVMDCGDTDHAGKLLVTTDGVRASALNGSDAETDAALIVAMRNHLPAIIAALRQPRAAIEAKR